MRHSGQPDDTGQRTVGKGLVLLAVLGGLFLFAAALPAGAVAIDLFGAAARGTVVRHAAICVGGWNTGIRCRDRAMVAFRTARGEPVEAHGLFEPAPLPRVGTWLDVRYLPAWPAQALYDRSYLADWLFWVLSAASIAFLWMGMLLVGKIAALGRPA